MQTDCDAYLWQHCPKTVHRFNAFAQRLDGQKGTNPALKWQSILVSSRFPHSFPCLHAASSPPCPLAVAFLVLWSCLQRPDARR